MRTHTFLYENISATKDSFFLLNHNRVFEWGSIPFLLCVYESISLSLFCAGWNAWNIVQLHKIRNVTQFSFANKAELEKFPHKNLWRTHFEIWPVWIQQNSTAGEKSLLTIFWHFFLPKPSSATGFLASIILEEKI